MTKTHGSVQIKRDDYTIMVDYEYYHWHGDFLNPPESELTIKKILYNSVDITSFILDYGLEDLFNDVIAEDLD